MSTVYNTCNSAVATFLSFSKHSLVNPQQLWPLFAGAGARCGTWAAQNRTISALRPLLPRPPRPRWAAQQPPPSAGCGRVWGGPATPSCPPTPAARRRRGGGRGTPSPWVSSPGKSVGTSGMIKGCGNVREKFEIGFATFFVYIILQFLLKLI